MIRLGAKQTLRWPGDRDPRDHVIEDLEWERSGSFFVSTVDHCLPLLSCSFVTRLTDGPLPSPYRGCNEPRSLLRLNGVECHLPPLLLPRVF